MRQTLEFLEKQDKIINALVNSLAAQEINEIILKGGTLLETCVFEDYRFSEDIDCDYIGFPDFEMPSILREVCDMASSHLKENVMFDESASGGWVKIIRWGEKYENKIKVESTAIKGSNLVSENQMWNVLDEYDLFDSSYSIKGYTLESVFADKFSCLSRRHFGRDLYDMDYISLYTKTDIVSAWQKYLNQYGNPDKEWQPTPHPSLLGKRLLELKPLIKEDWEEHDTLFTTNRKFGKAFNNIHGIISQLIDETNW